VNELSLFSGYGGFSLGLHLTLSLPTIIRTVGYVEIDPYCQAVIQQRIRDGFLDDAPIFPDICAFDGSQCRGVVDIITGGFPCQPHSVAGRQQGESDKRNLWPDTLRVISEVGPEYVLLENVPGILSRGYGGTVVGQLSEAGYDCIWGVVSAAETGAPHLRKRWWCLAQSQQMGAGREPRDLKAAQDQGEGQGSQREWFRSNSGHSSQDVDHSQSQRLSESRGSSRTPTPHPRLTNPSWWKAEPAVGRVVDGGAHRVDRLRTLGNGIVPSVAARFLEENF